MTNSYRSILVPIDGTAFAEQALPLALELARQHHAILHLAMVHQPASVLATAVEVPSAGFLLDEDSRRKEHDYIEALVDRLRPRHQPVSAVVLDGEVTLALETHIRLTLTDLVVTTTHGRGPLSRFWLGSVADHLVRHSEVPLILVRPDKTPAWLTAGSITKILVALDGSPFAEQALEQATRIGKSFGASFQLVYVIQPALPISDPNGMLVMPPTTESESILRAQASEYLEKVAIPLRARGLIVTCAAVIGAGVAQCLVEAASEGGADLVVLASHGLGGLKRVMLGSVADRLIRQTKVPLLVVRPGPLTI